ncbi:MAG TPA: hypothetical protein VMJ66_17290 [Geobacteraceae bacterium]|nr:hypothetical protein [Geobacteraceae bacterium]
MKGKSVVLVGCMVILSLCGCVTTMIAEKAASTAAPPDIEKFSFNLSTPGADAGKLTIQCRQPSYQMAVAKYAIKIDSKSPLVVSKQSDTDIILDAGKHTLKFYACSSTPEDSEKVSFGMSTTREVVIAKDKGQTLKYTGPYRLLGEGKIEVIQ